MSTSAQQPRRSRDGHVPGEPGLWVFVLGDMVAFAVAFAALVHDHARDPAAYAAGQDALHVELGIANTVVLLTSSLAVAVGVRAARGPRPASAAPWFWAAAASGVLFCAVKAVEWLDLTHEGHGPRAGRFEADYFAFTGLHALHVLAGIAVLLGVRRVVRRAQVTEGDRRIVEMGASYWHMVDVLWIVLFALLYLLG